LNDFDQKLADVERQQTCDRAYEDQDALIEYVTAQAGAQSAAARQLAAQRQVDIRGLSHVIEGLGRIVAAFVATVVPAVARVTQALKVTAKILGRSGREVVAAGSEVIRTAARTQPGGFAPGNRFRDFDAAPEMIVVAAGEFVMGSPEGKGDNDESPRHRVAIKNSFAVGIAPVTRGEFASFADATNYTKERSKRSWRNPGFDQGDDHPVVYVSWHDAQVYVAWLQERSGGKAYRLLSEAEWEYCCRAGTASEYSTGDSITAEQANFLGDVRGTTSVFRFPPNPWGLRDMHGNVSEWCEDNWHESYESKPPLDGSVWRGGDKSHRVMRGGSWINNPQDLRSAQRFWNPPDGRYTYIGFRVARTL
jgi:formylglycine-generating enzyme required for sulfatase activity